MDINYIKNHYSHINDCRASLAVISDQSKPCTVAYCIMCLPILQIYLSKLTKKCTPKAGPVERVQKNRFENRGLSIITFGALLIKIKWLILKNCYKLV